MSLHVAFTVCIFFTGRRCVALTALHGKHVFLGRGKSILQRPQVPGPRGQDFFGFYRFHELGCSDSMQDHHGLWIVGLLLLPATVTCSSVGNLPWSGQTHVYLRRRQELPPPLPDNTTRWPTGTPAALLARATFLEGSAAPLQDSSREGSPTPPIRVQSVS